MIVVMKKVFVVMQEKEAKTALRALRKLGLLHVEYKEPPKGDNIAIVENDIALVDNALTILSEPQFAAKTQTKKEAASGDWRVIARHIVDSFRRLNQLFEYQRTLQAQIVLWQAWGDFQPQAVQELSKKNIFVRFCQVPHKELKNFPEGIIVKEVSAEKGNVNCLIISRSEIKLNFKELPLPKMGLAQMQRRLKEDVKVMEAIRQDLKKQAGYAEFFKEVKLNFGKEKDFYRALGSMNKTSQIAYISGYIPFDQAEKLLGEARSQKWAVLITEPAEEDSIPTLIRSPRWVSLIAPVFKLLEIVPGYRELDVSPVFLCFLSLFFGMIIGDAGYGTLYFLLAFGLRKKFSHKIPDARIFPLLYLFSSCAIFWGLLTATVFGQEWFLKSGFKPLMPVLNDTKFLQAFCFFLGATHLTLAHAWQAVRKAPSLVALSDVGWISVLWAAFFLARTLILDAAFPAFGKWLIIVGVSLVILFTSPQKNILKTISQGLGAVALSLMNNFTDVVSYIRLFAVGLAGVAISDTVNALAAGLGEGQILGRALIVFLGHTLNIVMGPMSVLVHGVRLNVLEFSSHAGLSWSGVAYKPLTE